VTRPRLVSFPSRDTTLRGYLFTPPGSGPFPALVWNHGSERRPGSFEELGWFYASAGYVVLVPHRRGHGRSPGRYPLGTVPNGPRRRAVESILALHDRALEDTLAAVSWLRRKPFVDLGRMAMSGVSHGGIQTILAAEADAGMKAYVPFAPAAIAWPGNPEVQERLVRAVRAARAPIFLLQAENDYSLGPSEILGKELERKGRPNRALVYPPYGRGSPTGHGAFACRGMDVWGADVCAFLDEAMTPVRQGSPK
jgi:carboxymethylenebutenolidase